ncbi:hypothetical protein KDU71_07475 [Carboxylicivirga sediminis]|uniref:MmcB family DNA repair protein n=1 Tax=Carboxylicivirga sediminis TaxID=2006564 RepID=A0A941IVX2_9BACT|nr:hypothetical protein [Carboxylicivirga sediminis]MBR8535396.1 hypothetical protein [Carboxylicivirga sediminis]
MKQFTHRELCLKAARYLKNQGIVKFSKCTHVVCELEKIGECPDAFGYSNNSTQLIEVKVSRSDFLSDKKKQWRRFPAWGMGDHRSYLCPEGLIKPEELPDKWGLLYADGKGKISVIVDAVRQKSNRMEELNALRSIMRREGIKPGIFSYKKYANET